MASQGFIEKEGTCLMRKRPLPKHGADLANYLLAKQRIMCHREATALGMAITNCLHDAIDLFRRGLETETRVGRRIECVASIQARRNMRRLLMPVEIGGGRWSLFYVVKNMNTTTYDVHWISCTRHKISTFETDIVLPELEEGFRLEGKTLDGDHVHVHSGVDVDRLGRPDRSDTALTVLWYIDQIMYSGDFFEEWEGKTRLDMDKWRSYVEDRYRVSLDATP
jgi:hypothetical protein